MTDRPKRILIVRPSALGDVCRTVPALVMLRAAHPDAIIHWLVHEDFAQAVQHHPALSEVIAFPRKRFAHAWRHPRVAAEALRWSRQLADNQYDLAFDLQGLFRSGLFTWFSRAPRRIGFADAREGAIFGYNITHQVDSNAHTVDRMVGLLGVHGYEPSHDLHLHLGDADRAWRDAQFNGPYVCIAPTARWRCKCWPIERYADVARRLVHRGRRIVVLAAPRERQWIQPLLDVDPSIQCPQTTVGQLCAVIAGAQLLICNDSAPLHIAVGFDRPIVTLFGPTDPNFVGPYGRMDAVIQPDNITAEDMARYRRHKDDPSLIARIDVDTVWQRVEALLPV